MVATKKICAIIWISLSILTIAIICIAGDVLSIIFLSSNIYTDTVYRNNTNNDESFIKYYKSEHWKGTSNASSYSLQGLHIFSHVTHKHMICGGY